MNVKRFTARNSREALRLVREALGDDAVVVSTRPSAGGVEVVAMPPESIGHLEAMSTAQIAPAESRPEPTVALAVTSAAQDAERLSMSTLSFQDYVRTRMLRRRRASLDAAAAPVAAPVAAAAPPAPTPPPAQRMNVVAAPRLDAPVDEITVDAGIAELVAEPTPAVMLAPASRADIGAAMEREHALLGELRAVKELIEERFGALAFMEKLQRRPAEARLAQKLLDCGFSPMLVRKMAEGFKADAGDETEWAAQILERNLRAASADEAIENRGGVFALIGATGVGKTTTTAKIAAAFAARHGAGQLGLITLDAYRVGAHEQLRAYGRILGVPVHTAHDRASLDDLLELLAGKKMILIDTAGMAQRDTRTRELLDMLSHRSVQRLLVVNAASQGETIEDVLVAYRAGACAGMVLSKIDEAIKLGPALDAAIRHRLTVVGVANGQRVPEDWHRLSANALVQRAMRSGGSSAWRLEGGEVNLVFAASASAAMPAHG
ncbi:MAG TPA: flagellar biosynthesis protein FlhF [Caldimonas sp.]|nr:flagellar biosynthesis protein FlhF [Caldimonas sp.]HEX4233438.1 flagellar biosynthesis protein FlhF [Caldimonas sp.]